MDSAEDGRERGPGERRLALGGVPFGVAMASMLVAWGVGVAHRGMNDDEVMRTHSVWLVSQGLRPYGDFFELHPPYYRILVPVVRRFTDPCHAVLALRVLSSAANLMFLVTLAALASRSGPRRWAWMAVAGAACHPKVLDYLIEFRADAFGYALGAWAIARYLRPGVAGAARSFELGLIAGLATAWFCPKLTVLPTAPVALDQATRGASLRAATRAGLAYALGLALAVGSLVAYLLVAGIDLGMAYALLVQYQVMQNHRSAFGYGLFREVCKAWPLQVLVVSGVVTWVADLMRGRSWPAALDVALVLWLALQVAAVAYPHKQYYAPWFLFASVLVAHLGYWLDRLPGSADASAQVLCCVAIVASSSSMTHQWALNGRREEQCVTVRQMNRIGGPGDRVVAALPEHPMYRLDANYLWFNAWDPKRFDSEKVLSLLPATRRLVTEDHYREELEAHPPAFLVAGGKFVSLYYPPHQGRALAAFTRGRGYAERSYGRFLLAIRRDLANSPVATQPRD